MSPEHARAIGALADVVENLGESTSKVAKSCLKELKKDHPDVARLVALYLVGANQTADGLTAEAFLQCAVSFGLTTEELGAGVELSIVDGRYAVRRASGMKLGPAVS